MTEEDYSRIESIIEFGYLSKVDPDIQETSELEDIVRGDYHNCDTTPKEMLEERKEEFYSSGYWDSEMEDNSAGSEDSNSKSQEMIEDIESAMRELDHDTDQDSVYDSGNENETRDALEKVDQVFNEI